MTPEDGHDDALEAGARPEPPIIAERVAAPPETLPGGDDAPACIVGIGASAGGLQALEQFFRQLPPNPGMAFVVIQHLSPDFKSVMDELLARHTRIRIRHAADGMPIERDTIYLIPPRSTLTVAQNILRVAEPQKRSGLHLPIDAFFESLARDAHDRSVAVVLSGTGSDGTRGIRAIKEHGGTVIVQDEATAEFDGMPRSAIQTGLADFVLAAENMAGELLRLVKHPLRQPDKGPSPLLEQPTKLEEIVRLLKHHHEIDFSAYKVSTFGRRVERRMGINHVEDLNEYINLLASSRQETQALVNDLLIHVTRFFRDPAAWEHLRQEIFPKIIRATADTDVIRIWSAACSTGEEAYSLAILLHETLAELGEKRQVKIFATDLDQGAIETASVGRFPETIGGDVSPARLTRYFQSQDGAFEVVRALREMAIFTTHNVIKDPPFTRIDLVACRNLLIYLKPHAQQRVLANLHFALKPDGYLFLGPSESIAEAPEGYRVKSERFKVLQKDATANLSLARHASDREVAGRLAMPLGAPDTPSRLQVPASRISNAYLKLAETFAPAGLLLSERYEILHTFGDMSRFIEVTPGIFTSDATKLITADLRIAMSTALHRATRSTEPVVYENVRVRRNDELITINLRVNPLTGLHGDDRLFFVAFEEKGGVVPQVEAREYDFDDQKNQRISDLELELQQTRENLQASVEEVETSNEELQSTNEELMASNEELQGANEELHSVNEELYTINAEYRAKIEELEQLNNDFDNLLHSTSIGVVFVDRQRSIRRFTPAIRDFLNVRDADIGRPIDHFTHRLTGVDVDALLGEVIESGQAINREVSYGDGRYAVLRILPFLTQHEGIEGGVLALVDISDLRASERELVAAHERIAFHLNNSPLAFIEWNDEFRVRVWSQRATEMFGWTAEEVVGKHPESWSLVHPDDREVVSETMQKLLDGRTPRSVQFNRNVRKDGEVVYVEWYNSVETNDAGRVVSVFSLAHDVTEREQVRRALEAQGEARFRAAAASSLDALYLLRSVRDDSGAIVDFEFVDVNAPAEALLVYSREQLIGAKLCELIPVNRTGGFFERYKQVVETGQPAEAEFAIDAPEVRARWMQQQVVPFEDGVAITARDITTRKHREEALLRSEARFRSAFDDSMLGMSLTKLDGSFVRVNPALLELTGYTHDELMQRGVASVTHPDDQVEDQARLEQLLAGPDSAYQCRKRYLHKDGTEIPVLASVSLVRDSEGQPLYFVKQVLDLRQAPLPRFG